MSALLAGKLLSASRAGSRQGQEAARAGGSAASPKWRPRSCRKHPLRCGTWLAAAPRTSPPTKNIKNEHISAQVLQTRLQRALS